MSLASFSFSLSSSRSPHVRSSVFLGKKLGYIVLSHPRSNPPNRFWGRGSISTISLAITASLSLTASSSTNLNPSRTTNPSGRETQEEILVVDVGRQPDCNIVLTHPSISRFKRFVIRQAGIVEGLDLRGHSASGIEIERGRGRQRARGKGRQRGRESGKGRSRDRSLRVSQLGGHADGDRDRDRRGRQRERQREKEREEWGSQRHCCRSLIFFDPFSVFFSASHCRSITCPLTHSLQIELPV